VKAREKKPPFSEYSYIHSYEVPWPLSVQSARRVQRVVRRGKSLY
jgi:hypothetical protein